MPVTPLFRTPFGVAHVGEAADLLAATPDASVDLVLTSPPFALLRQKAYGNPGQDVYVNWLCGYADAVRRVLKDTGSYALDLGGAYEAGRPVRSLHQFRALLRHVDAHGFRLAEEFYWHNPSKLPSPIEWVNKRNLWAKDTVNTVWWLSKTDWPKANVANVLAPYSERMKTLLKDPAKFYTPADRPSGHAIGGGFAKDNGGAIPSHLLQLPNTESNGAYLRRCKRHGVTPHPARFPASLPAFFIKMLTDPGDTVLDIFGGSGTTAEAAEHLGRRWATTHTDPGYVRGAALRFVPPDRESDVAGVLSDIDTGRVVALSPSQPTLYDLEPVAS